MPKTVVINNTSFNIPDPGEENYSEELQAYLVEVATVLNTLSSPLDILQTDFNFANNQITPANVTGLNFPTSNIASFITQYIIIRDNGTNKITEQGTLIGFQGASGWKLSQANVSNDVNETDSPGVGLDLPSASEGDIGITFSITSAGQVQYTSNNYSSQTSGIITFKAKALEQ